MTINIPYYEDNTRISNSAIGWFIKWGPSYLRRRLDGEEPEEKSNAMSKGTMIHEYILQPEEFNKDYIVWRHDKPSSAQQEAFCRSLVNSVEIEPDKALLSAYKEAYSTTGKSDDKMLSEATKIASMLKEYISFLKSNDNRIMISSFDEFMLKQIAQNIKKHVAANNLLTDKEDTLSYNEFHINWDYNVYGKTKPECYIPCKSLLDRVIFDTESKTCTIIDLKTTHNLWTFEDSINKYDYLRQLCFYYFAATWYIEEELDRKHITDWTFKFYIIAIDTDTYEIRVFNIPYDYVILNRGPLIDLVMKILYWHVSNNKWDHSVDYYTKSGIELPKIV